MLEFLQQSFNGLSLGSLYALIALGYTMVYGVLRLINFAHGEVYMVGAISAYYAALHSAGLPVAIRLPFILLAAMLAAALLGFLIETFAYRPLQRGPRLNILITAIAVSLLLQGLGERFFGIDARIFPDIFPASAPVANSGLILEPSRVVILVLSFALMLGLHFLVQYSRWGQAMRAVAFNRQAALLVGIPVSRVIRRTFLLGSALAGAAGVFVALTNPSVEPLMGYMPGIKSFIAAVIGGIGSIPGALLGGLLLGILETFVTAYISSTYRDALAFVLLIVILLIKPQGILGKKGLEKV